MTQPNTDPSPTGATPEPASDSSDPHAEADGFGHSRRRLGLEIVLIAVAVIGLPLFVIKLAGDLAESLLRYIPISADQSLGRNTYQAMASAQDVCDNPELLRYVETITSPLVGVAESELSFEFRVVADEAVNAYALPGGFITINLGLLQAAESGEELAGVVAHEIQHAVLRHSTARLLTELGGVVVLSVLFGGTDLQAPVGAISNLAKKSYGRDQEAQADREGVALMQRAGVDPRGMTRFFERLSKENPERPPELLSTHPDPGRRATNAVRATLSAPITIKLPSPPKVGCH